MSKSNDWMESWLNAQQTYWRAWGEMAQRGMKTPEAPKNPLSEGLEQWWQAVSPMAPPAGREVFDKLMRASKGYYSLAERFMSGGERDDGGMAAIDGWLDGMRGMWEDWSKAGAAFSPEGMFPGQPHGGFATFWDLPMDTWNRMVANVMPMPGDFTQAFHAEGGNPVQQQVNRFLSIPAVGYTREAQEQAQHLAQRQLDYMAAMQAYQAAFGKLGVDSVQGFQQALRARAKEGKPIGSLRELYDQWVEMSEAAYADFVMTEEYQTLYGRLVNSLLALKQQMARMVDQNLEAMHMPTHAEIVTLQCRQQELRRENLKLKKEINEIHKKLEALKEAISAPVGHPSASEARPAAATPKPRGGATPSKPVAASKPRAAKAAATKKPR